MQLLDFIADLDAHRVNLHQKYDYPTKGIGSLSLARLNRYNDEMIKAGVFKAGDVDVKTLATEKFVNKGVGLDIRARLVK